MEESNVENQILSNTSIGVFDKCNRHMLVGFVMVMKINIAKTKLLNKGKFAAAIDADKKLICLVFESRDLKHMLDENLRLVGNTNDELDDEIGNNLLTRFSVEIKLSNDSLLIMKSSDLLYNEEWTSNVGILGINSLKLFNIIQVNDD